MPCCLSSVVVAPFQLICHMPSQGQRESSSVQQESTVYKKYNKQHWFVSFVRIYIYPFIIPFL